MAKSFTNRTDLSRHLSLLADQYTYSDGETFTAAIQRPSNLATVVGKQNSRCRCGWLTGRTVKVTVVWARVASIPCFPGWSLDHWRPRHRTWKYWKWQLPYCHLQWSRCATWCLPLNYWKKKLRKSYLKPLKAKPFPKDISPASASYPSVKNPKSDARVAFWFYSD